jgi:L-iditol 2-dehydrogenase
MSRAANEIEARAMRAAVCVGPGRVRAEPWPVPAIGPGELLLRVRGCGLCGSDIAKIADPASRSPAVLGHEVVGEVIEVDPGAAGFAPGDRVIAAHHVPCGACHYCRRQSPSMCRAFRASNLDPGGFAEYVRVPAPNVAQATFRVPAHVSDEAASFVEPLACCLRALRRARVEPGDTVVVVGLGSIGHLFVQLLRRAGARVVPVEAAPERLDFAARLGVEAWPPSTAAAAVAERSEGRGADHVLITGGGAAVLGWAEPLVRDGGAVHYFAGGTGPALPVAVDTLYRRELTVTATYSSSPADLAEAFRLVVAGGLVLEPLYTHRVGLDRLEEAVALMRSRRAVKVYVTP